MTRVLRTGGRVVSPTLIGREDELALLLAAVMQPPAGIWLEGEAGIGKSRLVSELLRRPEIAGRTKLLGRCHPIRESFPLGAIVEAVRRLGGQLDRIHLGPAAGALRPLIPELATSLPPPPDPLDDRGAERHRVFRGLVEVLRAAGSTVLVLEDVHWADEQTTDFLAYLVPDPPPELALVLTYRGEEVNPSVAALRSRLFAEAASAHVVLGPLVEDECGALAAAILSAESVSAEFSHYLLERTSGLPFAIEEVLALIRARGQVVHRWGRWNRRALEDLEVPTGIRDSTLERVAQLSPGARRFAEAAAVLQIPSPVPVLLATSGDAAGVEALEEAVGSGLLAERDELIGFRHLLAAQAVHESLSTQRRRQLHERAAAALRGADTVPLGQVAHHLQRAGRPTEWARAAEAAAAQAVALGHEDEAVRLLGDVVHSAALPPPRRGELAIRLGWAALDTLHARDVIEPLERVLDKDLPEGMRGELKFLVAIALGQAGADQLRQQQLLTDAIAEVGDRPDLRAWALVGLAVNPLIGSPLSENVRYATEALQLVDALDDPLLEVFVLGKAGSVLMETGDPAWRRVADRVRAITGDAPRQRREANAYYSLGVSACYTGHLDVAESLLSKGLAASAARQNRRLEVMLRSGLVVVRYLLGAWDDLRREVDELLDDVADYATSRLDVELVAGNLDLAHGAVEQAAVRLEQVSELAAEIGAIDVASVALGSSTRAALARNDLEAALTCAQRLVDGLGVKKAWPSVAWALPVIVEAWTAAGEGNAAQEFLACAEREVRDLDAPLAVPALHFSRGILLGSAGEFRAAAAGYDAADVLYEAARAREMAASALLGSGASQLEAASLLRDSYTSYQRLGATRDCTRASRLARRHGMRLPRQHRGGQRAYGSALSPREQEIVALAATGRTNDEIARTLFISTSTVEKHVAAAMRKLGSRSRTELGHRLALLSKNGGFPQ